MSLINDALKRASAQKVATAVPPAYAPLHAAVDSGPSTGPLPVILCIVGVGALLMAGAFWLKAKGTPPLATDPLAPSVVARVAAKTEQAAAATTPIAHILPSADNPVAPQTTLPQPAVQPIAAAHVPAAAAQAQPLAISEQAAVPQAVDPVVTPAPVPAHVVQDRPKTTSTALHLQAIYYRMKGPTVIINGKTLRLGDSFEGAKLVGIERTAAEVEIGGVRRRLTMH